ncbi:hypothetical protein NW752_009002 [Fusarium irregulare]|uniref:RRM domain-containing protein n=1 Tax=Fusarium irregulare TaxID=2494466 RepID=A0A9W8PKW8_9HYPO|nr:hypothetical protein NW766_009236 [Fusarium irregulare]KAJ4010874.1 hypothetical protein NW752_009002 [Fusarium irregulare]
MADKMDRGLDEIIADTRSNRPRNNRGQGRRREPRNDFPRDGVRKVVNGSTTDLKRTVILEASPKPRHPFDHRPDNRRAPAPRRRRESPEQDSKGAKIRVENIHYDLTDDDLSELFQRIGPVSRLQLRYDRAGRSEGTAYVTYESKEDAQEAVKQFDGANANGQPIRLTLLPNRNPFDTAVMPGRPLSERISSPGDRRSHSPHRRRDDDDAARRGIDRYVPGQGSRRSPMPRSRGQGQGQGRGQGGRRPGARREGREGGGRDQEGSRVGRGNRPSKKTQEELDAEMADYFGGDNAQAAEPGNQQDAPPAQAPAAAQPQAQAATDDIDMIE